MNKGNTIILPSFTLIVIIGMISGCIGEDEGDSDLIFSGRIDSISDTLLIKVQNGDINWTGKEVRVGNHKLVTSLVSSEDGDEVEFVDTTDAFDAEEGGSYTVIIIYLVSGKILWEGNITAEPIGVDEPDTVETINIMTEIDGTADEVIFEIISGKIDWSIYSIRVDGSEKFTTTAGNVTAGNKTIFKDPDGTTDLMIGTSYVIKIITNLKNKVVYESDVIATSSR